MIEIAERQIFDLCSRLGIFIAMNRKVSQFNKRIYYLDCLHTFMMTYNECEDNYTYSLIYTGREDFIIKSSSYTILLNTYDRVIKEDGFLKDYKFWKEGLK